MSDIAAKLVERYFGEVWNEGRVEVLDELLTEDYVNHSPAGQAPAPGPRGLAPIVQAMRAAMPDLTYEVLDVVATDDKVAVRTRVRGTLTGALFGVAPTGRAFDVEQMQIEHLRDGRIAAHWRLTDELTQLRQLGLLDPGA